MHMQRVGAAWQKVLIRIHLVLATIVAWMRRTLMQSRRVLCALRQLLVPPPLDTSPSHHPYSLPGSMFSPYEAQRLVALRQRFLGRPDYLETEINERRLMFARWLVEHGQLTEFPVLASDLPPQGDQSARREPDDGACHKQGPAQLMSGLPGRSGPSLASPCERTQEHGVSVSASQ
jgi:hypothetical protein